MQLSQSVRLKQKQSLVMTPQLQQAIRLLQMTNVELTDYLEEQALENPFLEVTTAGEASSEKTPPQDTPDTPPASDTAETPATLDSMSEGQALTDDPTQHNDFENRFSSEGLQLGQQSSGSTAGGAGGADWDMIASVVANREDSLNRHVMAQIDLAITDERDRFIAISLLEGLAPSGWLDLPLDAVATSCQCSVEAVEDVLGCLQQFETNGAFRPIPGGMYCPAS